MADRSRWALALALPVFGAVFLSVRAVWRAYVESLNESELHLRVFNHAMAVTVIAWVVILALTLGITSWVAGRLAARDRAASSERAD